MSETKLDVRGFHVKSPEAKELLETVGRTFLTGYGYAAEAARPADAEAPLQKVPERFRGFAYEGAAMGFAVRDAMPVPGRSNVGRFLEGEAEKHIYMVYVGIGWAMARLPRFLWPSLHAPDPLLRWLALDGYGFHQAYFKTDQYVYQRFQEQAFPWPSPSYASYSPRVIDQGIGRAIWFVCGTDVELVAMTLNRFPESRRADLFAGAGLAATYAGGASEEELQFFNEAAGEYRCWVAQGSAFAAGARVRAGLVVPHNDLATQIFCGMAPEKAHQITEEALSGLQDGEVPGYEVWRQRIAAKFA